MNFLQAAGLVLLVALIVSSWTLSISAAGDWLDSTWAAWEYGVFAVVFSTAIASTAGFIVLVS